MTARHESWYHERESAWLYRRVAEHEPDPRKQQLFISLADAAERQAQRWVAHRAAREAFVPSLRARVIGETPALDRPAISEAGTRGHEAARAVGVRRGSAARTSDAHLGRTRSGATPARLGQQPARGDLWRERRPGVEHEPHHGRSRQRRSGALILPAGVAGLLAGALSMAAGEYVSVRSQREMYEYQIGLERDELAEYPEEEAEELALIYNARGMELSRAREASRQIMASPSRLCRRSRARSSA